MTIAEMVERWREVKITKIYHYRVKKMINEQDQVVEAHLSIPAYTVSVNTGKVWEAPSVDEALAAVVDE